MNIWEFAARQYRKPSGKLSGIFASYMNWDNYYLNKLAVKALEIQPNDHVLEVGFGGGFALNMIKKKIRGGFLAGVDYSQDMVNRGKRKFQKSITTGHMTLIEANVISMPFSDASFDKIYSIHTIYFWPDITTGLMEIIRVLKPGGRSVIGIMPKESMEKTPIKPYGFSMYSEQELKNLLAQAGFKDQQTIHRKNPIVDALVLIATKS